MPQVEFEQAVADFLAMGKRLQGTKSLTAEQVLDQIISWYQGTRIEGAKIEEDGDCFFFNGAQRRR